MRPNKGGSLRGRFGPSLAKGAAFAWAPAVAYEPRTRHYPIAAEKVEWDYAPSGENRIHHGEGLGPRVIPPEACELLMHRSITSTGWVGRRRPDGE
jgi:hypothetical protein